MNRRFRRLARPRRGDAARPPARRRSPTRSSIRPRSSPGSTRSPAESSRSRRRSARRCSSARCRSRRASATRGRRPRRRRPTPSPKSTRSAENHATHRIFTGWMFADSPGMHGVEHPVYDIWLTDCKGDGELIHEAPEVADAPSPDPPDTDLDGRAARRQEPDGAEKAPAAQARDGDHRNEPARPRRGEPRPARPAQSADATVLPHQHGASIPGRYWAIARLCAPTRALERVMNPCEASTTGMRCESCRAASSRRTSMKSCPTPLGRASRRAARAAPASSPAPPSPPPSAAPPCTPGDEACPVALKMAPARRRSSRKDRFPASARTIPSSSPPAPDRR